MKVSEFLPSAKSGNNITNSIISQILLKLLQNQYSIEYSMVGLDGLRGLFQP